MDYLDHFIDNLCWGTFCRTEERCQVKADVHDTLLAGILGTLTLSRRERVEN
jgi:hypothetical protein